MTLFENILTELNLLLEEASVSDINTSITKMFPAIIKYDDGEVGGGKNNRIIYPVAYGISTAGNPVIRAFQPQGSSKKGTPKWKLFRLDRIKSWRTVSSKTYDANNLKGFNEDGDSQMQTLYTIAPIGAAKSITKQKSDFGLKATPITKKDVENIETSETPDSNKQEFTANDTINSLINNIKAQKKIDNITGISDTDKNGSDINAPETNPIRKSEITQTETPTVEKQDGDIENDSVSDSPIMKQDLNGSNNETDTQNHEEIRANFNNMLSRMNKLNNNEQDNNEQEDANK